MSNQFFLTEEENDKGQFDWNADKYAQKQQQFANDLEDTIGYEFWPTKPRFAEYDYHIINPFPVKFVATATVIPGIPIYGIAELKYRNVTSKSFPDTVVDTEKIVKMKERVNYTDLPVYIFFRFTDMDLYYKVDLTDKFNQTLNRNTNTTKDEVWEYKPISHIPTDKLRPVSTIRRING